MIVITSDAQLWRLSGELNNKVSIIVSISTATRLSPKKYFNRRNSENIAAAKSSSVGGAITVRITRSVVI